MCLFGWVRFDLDMVYLGSSLIRCAVLEALGGFIANQLAYVFGAEIDFRQFIFVRIVAYAST